MKQQLFRLANKLYEHCYPVYYPLYASWKALSDRRERSLFRHLIQQGTTVVDVGANIGVYTRFFANLTGESGHVHAFEPAPLNFKRLQDNVGTLKNVSVNQVAVGACQGTINLFVSNDLNVDHRTFDSEDGRSSISVPVESLDEYFAIGQRVDFIKIDVQGYEFSVLQGAQRILEENHEIKILMEFWPYGLTKAGVDPNTLIELIQSYGFEIRETSNLNKQVFNANKLDPNCIDDYCNLLLSRRHGPYF